MPALQEILCPCNALRTFAIVAVLAAYNSPALSQNSQTAPPPLTCGWDGSLANIWNSLLLEKTCFNLSIPSGELATQLKCRWASAVPLTAK
jgi:hypothetical protein